MTQRRHASAFYPHSLCNKRSEEMYMGDPSEIIYPIEYDVGLIKLCYPFKTGSTISVAPIHPTTNLARDLRIALQHKKVCLFAGWGEILAYGERLGGQTKLPNVLFHEWRHIDCSPECTFGLRCVICSSHHGKLLSYPTKGDSGLPVVCDGKLIGVHNSGGAYFSLNISFSLEFPLACADKYLAAHFLAQLAALKDNIFHYIDGNPVTYKNRLKREDDRDYMVYDHSSSSQLFFRHTYILFFMMLPNSFSRGI
ncbi:hypothetical protein GE061_019568 [Apolygus lucorum]|uniref:Peptidase S1 domain-containing protein n=1 Tax=Apolygus lucorum TaxID=248454 RepID=A0A6A4JZW2_APOLU|nr:hypothetical protein GE061_019568 [Apolygus lucorum]